MPTYLDDLIAGARRRAADTRAAEPMDVLRTRALASPPPPSFLDAVSGRDVAVIAEIKRASPSKGPIAPGLVATDLAGAYVDGGASAVSVLTEPDRFGGSLEDLEAVSALGVPTLRKDFIVDECQVWEARAAGASAVLLIVAALEVDELQRLHAAADDAGLTALVEVHDDHELALACDVGARLIGVNARDLVDFTLDTTLFSRLRPTVPDGVRTVAESGIERPGDVARRADEGADAVLVGESLVRAADPRAAVAALVAAGRRTAVSVATDVAVDRRS